MLEPNIYGLWVGKQTAKGTPNVAPGKRLVWLGGDFGVAVDDTRERFSDLSKFGNAQDVRSSVLGQGEPAIAATPTELAYLLWLFHGGETVTPVTGPPAAQRHVTKPTTGRGHWCSFARRMGQSIIQRHLFADCMVTRIQIEGSTQNKVVRATARILSLDPAIVKAADPAAAMPTDDAIIYTDGTGTFTIDGVVIRGQSQFTFVIDEDLSPVFADDVNPHDLVQGTPAASLAVTLKMDADAVARWNAHVYGNATPSTDAKPLKTIPAMGTYACDLKQRDAAGTAMTGREFDLAVPAIQWAVPDLPPPNPEGGDVEIALAGELRPIPANDLYTIGVNTANTVTAFTT